ncbi:MAG TPA: hypothetical protein VD864_13335 [Nocardioides sp.]|nr:hypothetical protein [Nocardioides sp.]
MRTLLRGCAALIVVVVLVGAIGYVAHGLRGAARVADARERARDELAAALPAGRQEATREHDRVQRAVTARWGSPAYSWQELVCDLDTRDAGWIVQSYEQYCRIRTVDLVPAPAAEGAECEYPWVRSGPLAGVDLVRGPTAAFDRERPYEAMCPDGIMAPLPWGASRLLGGARPSSLDESAGWLVVTTSTELSRTDLGCDPWKPVFCSAPVDDPVLDDAG